MAGLAKKENTGPATDREHTRLQEQTTAINERLILSSIRQHELTEAAEKLNADLQAEIDGQLRKIMVVIKMRGGNHSKDIREYVITDEGVVLIGPRQTDYRRLTTGLPERTGQATEAAPEPKAKT